MKCRRNCRCPCHSGGVALHFVPCCEGMLPRLLKKVGLKRNKRASAARACTLTGVSVTTSDNSNAANQYFSIAHTRLGDGLIVHCPG